MTDDEFNRFSRRLFIAFPSLREWLGNASDDPQETLRVWRQCLKPYPEHECQAVLDAWSTGQLRPFEAYERDKVHLCIRAVVEGTRSKKREAANRERDIEYHRAERRRRDELRARRGQGMAEGLAGTLTSAGRGMVSAFLELRPLHQQLLDGEIDKVEYAVMRGNIIRKHLDQTEESEESHA